MKNVLRIVFFIFLSFELFAETAQEVNIDYVRNKAPAYDSVIVEGTVVQRLGKDKFVLQDDTGFIVISLDGPLNKQYRIGLEGATVRVYALVHKKGDWDSGKLKVLKLRVLKAGDLTIEQSEGFSYGKNKESGHGKYHSDQQRVDPTLIPDNF